MNVGLVLAGRGEVSGDVDALGLEPVHEVVQAALHVLLDERLGRLDRDEPGELVEHAVAQRHLRLQLADHRDALAAVLAQRVDACRTR